MTVKTIGSKEARQNWRSILDSCIAHEADFVIERNGKGVAAVIPFDDFVALAEALDELRAARRAEEIYDAYKADPSSAVSLPEFEAELEAEGLLDEKNQ